MDNLIKTTGVNSNKNKLCKSENYNQSYVLPANLK